MSFSKGKFTLALSLLTACCLNFSSNVFAEEDVYFDTNPPNQEPPPQPSPWLTGPLLTPSGNVIPSGHYNIEPYQFITTNYGSFDNNWNPHSGPKSYNLTTSVPIQIGIPCYFDITFAPTWAWNHTSGASHWVLNDMNFGFDYQILQYKRGGWYPSIKLNVSTNIPWGRYQKLHPKSKGTDIGGSGSWAPNFGLVLSHLYWWGGHIFFAPRFNVQYTIPTAVHVKNYNTYGGGHHTNGTVYPGQRLRFLFGFEIALSQRWVFANDVMFVHASKNRFSGRKGATGGVPNVVKAPSSEQWSLAPAIEYNWSPYYGIIAGCWFSIAGRNTGEFASAVVAINIYH